MNNRTEPKNFTERMDRLLRKDGTMESLVEITGTWIFVTTAVYLIGHLIIWWR